MRGDTRGQSGLDRLMVFVLAIVAVVAALPFLLGFGGVDVRGPSDGATGPSETDGGVVVLDASGQTGGFGDPSVGVVRVTITAVDASLPVDLSATTVTWDDADGSYVLVPAGTADSAADGEFGVATTGPSSGDVLKRTADRATLTFDVGTDDADDIAEFGRRLRPGETVTLYLTAGETDATVTLQVPESPGDKEVVSL